jgi:hypothetical protein
MKKSKAEGEKVKKNCEGSIRIPTFTFWHLVQDCTRSKMSKVHKVKS